jgi:t-SNARE complex subunit (syntaxin)
MRRVGQQGHRVGHQAKGDSGHHEAEVQCSANRKRAVMATGVCVVMRVIVMVVVMFVHASGTMAHATLNATGLLTNW